MTDQEPPNQLGSTNDLIALRLPRHRVKAVKDILEQQGGFNKLLGVELCDQNTHERLIYTNLTEVSDSLLEDFSLTRQDVVVISQPEILNKHVVSRQSTNVIEKAIESWLNDVACPELDAHKLVATAPSCYSIYGPMLLFPPGSFDHPTWTRAIQIAGHRISSLYDEIARDLSVTHIAINAPIPLVQNGCNNIIRAPVSLKALRGDFGPEAVTNPPSKEDFDAAFWASTKQNGISQIWAPRHTMFSRGNIKEKARILDLSSVKEAVDMGRQSGAGCSAVDLYAGIGYFAFSYAKAGFDRVLCWEINPWSTEGLWRVAGANRWAVTAMRTDQPDRNHAIPNSRLVVFPENNESAGDAVDAVRSQLPPIRHVNCGLLPSSKNSWAVAVAVLDPELGGWLHVHENIAIKEISQRSHDIMAAIRELAARRWQMVSTLIIDRIVLEHVEKVKSYAPGVFHCVLDIRLHPGPGMMPS